MLRPACWLPPKRLVTPRSGHRALARCLGSATRRSGAYRGGTCTRWRRTACSRRSVVYFFTTHHVSILVIFANSQDPTPNSQKGSGLEVGSWKLGVNSEPP